MINNVEVEENMDLSDVTEIRLVFTYCGDASDE